MRLWRILAISLVLAIAVLPAVQGPALALVQQLNLDELTAKADCIVVGQVRAINSHQEVQEGIYTLVTIAVEQPIKGKPDKDVVLQLPGGKAGNRWLWVEDVPNFQLGERTVVFLESMKTNYTVCGWNQGKYTIRNDMVVERKQPLSSFIAEIKRAMSAPKTTTGLHSRPVSMVLEYPLEGMATEPLSTGEFVTGWQNIMTDGFEGSFPGVWAVGPSPSYTDAYWGKDNYRANSGSYSAFCAKSGTAGVNPPSHYPNNMSAWMVYGPFDLTSTSDAELNYYLWLEAENPNDGILIMASVNGINFYGDGFTGSSGGNWFPMSLDLTNVNTLGNLCGQSRVWIAFLFLSNATVNNDGVFIDDVELRKFVSTGPLPQITSISPDTASAGTASQVTISGTNFGATQGASQVGFWRINDTYISAPVVSWSDTGIVCEVPAGASSGDASHGVIVQTSAGASNDFPFTVTFSYAGYKWLLTNPMSEKYVINANTGDCDGELQAVLQAMQTWNNVGSADFYFEYGGPTTTSTYNPNDNGSNEICWISTDPPGFPAGWIAVNMAWGSGNEITESDILFNDHAFTWDTSGAPAPGQMDVQSIASHELGHTFCLLDVYGSADALKTMFGYGSTGDIEKRTLEPQDIAGMQWIYPDAGTRGQYHVQVTNNDDDDLTVFFKADTDAGYEAYRQVYVPAGQTVTSFWEVLLAGSHQGVIKWTDPDKGIDDFLSSGWLDVPIEGDTGFSLAIPQAGDANGDGSVDIFDLVKVKKIILGIDPYFPGADANQDGSVDIFDLVKIKKIILGLE